jgi:hypothetical protein
MRILDQDQCRAMWFIFISMASQGILVDSRVGVLDDKSLPSNAALPDSYSELSFKK